MPRSCLCQRLLTRAASDAAFRLLPDPVQLLWFRLVSLATVAPVPGRLRFLHSVPSSVARLVSRPETEIATELRDLAELGLVDPDADGVTLWMPGAREGSARAEAARRNGLLGGARRKGETAEQRRDRRQRELMLPLAGGTQGTEAATEAATEPDNRTDAPVSTSTGESESPPGSGGGDRARETPAWVSLGVELAARAGMDGARGGFDYRPVQAWLNAGIPPEVIRAAVEAAIARPSYQPGRAYSLKFFDKAVLQAAEEAKARQAVAPRVLTAEQRRAEAAAMDALDRRVDAILLGQVRPGEGLRGAA